MPTLKSAFNPLTYARYVKRRLKGPAPESVNQRGVTFFAPGHFYSPLLDLESLNDQSKGMPFDGADCWDCVDLGTDAQKAYFRQLLALRPNPGFPETKTEGMRFFLKNQWFPYSDALTLSGVICAEKPRRIVEVGSGFSSAVMLDTIQSQNLSTRLTCVEPYPDRLLALLSKADMQSIQFTQGLVQEVPISEFESLDAGDLLFIDSSHVAKVGSDVAHLFLRVLPRLKAGVIVHVHDIFYPFSYPLDWIKKGWAWNESLFLRAFLSGNSNFEVLAFNSFAGFAFPEIFRPAHQMFVDNSGGSFYMRKIR